MLIKTVVALAAICTALAVAHAEEQPKFGGSFEPANQDYLSMYGNQQNQQQDQQAAAAYNATTDVDAVIDTILATGRSGRNLDGFDDVYADPTVQDALAKSDDRQARNIIKDKLCSLGLMDCDNQVQIEGKRPFLPPGELIYSQPPPGYHQSGVPLQQQRPPQHQQQQQRPPPGAYGPPRPMPPPQSQKYTGPPRKVGYVGSPYPGNNQYQMRPPGQSLYVESKPPAAFYEGPSPPGPIYQGGQQGGQPQRPFDGQIFEGPKPPGPIYEDNSSPYKFDTSSSSIHQSAHHEQVDKYETVNDYPTQKIVATPNAPAGGNTVNIHHHYHHLDGAADGTKTVVVNPVSATQGSASYVSGSSSLHSSSANSLNGLSASAEYSGLSSGGFSPMNSLGGGSSSSGSYFNKQQQLGLSSYGNGPSSAAYKPVIEPSNNLIGVSGPGSYDGAVNSYGGVINSGSGSFNGLQQQQQFGASGSGQYGSGSGNSPQQSFHSQHPEFYKKALNTNGGGASTNSLSSLSQYSKYNTQYNTGENSYQGFETARQESFDCVCVPYDQCPQQDVIGRKDDLILPLDPRNLKTDIEAAADEQVAAKSSNATVTAEKRADEKKETVAADEKKTEGEKKKVVKREAPIEAEKKADDVSLDQADGQARQAYYQQQQQRPQQQCNARQVCCRRPIQQQQQVPSFQAGQCGRRNTNGITGRIKNPSYIDGDSEFGEYPWQVAILKKDPKESVYICGGTLIDGQHILTAAHCVKTYTNFDLRVRLGEWDVNHDVEFFPYIERDVVSVTVHPEYYAGTLDNDLAIIRLNAPVDFANAPHISPACLPDRHTDWTGARCWTTGWGKDAFGDFGKYQNILKEVDVPVIGQQQCQQQLRGTRLGYSYKLNPGFICAGGEEGKDACKGDGGGPMVCERNGSWQLVGVVSWGIGCGQVNVPGVYVRVAHYLDWIQANTRRF